MFPTIAYTIFTTKRPCPLPQSFVLCDAYDLHDLWPECLFEHFVVKRNNSYLNEYLKNFTLCQEFLNEFVKMLVPRSLGFFQFLLKYFLIYYRLKMISLNYRIIQFNNLLFRLYNYIYIYII